jgi:cytochrome c-type biogenesis protein CcmH
VRGSFARHPRASGDPVSLGAGRRGRRLGSRFRGNDGWRGAVAGGLLLALAAPASADSLLPPADYANTQLADPRQEQSAAALMETLRCLVCQGQSIADSDADMAGDMRALVRRRIADGEQPEAVRAWLIGRYGNWVTYDPPLEPVTWPLWAAPILLIGAGLYLARGRFRRRGR